MKIGRFLRNDEKPFFGILSGKSIYRLADPGPVWHEWDLSKRLGQYDINEVQLLAPCQPSKVVCLGLNYRSHARELGLEPPENPVIFMKPSTAVIGSGQSIKYPSCSKRIDYEAELGVVIGKRASKVSRKKAYDHIFGYTCVNDVTARDKQQPDGQWTYAKSFDTFCPIGPAIETEIANPENLPIRGLLNGKVVQEASTADHLFSIDYIIEYVSACMTLLPGDIIITGTPSGIGPMNVSDTFTVAIDGIGNLTNLVI